MENKGVEVEIQTSDFYNIYKPSLKYLKTVGGPKFPQKLKTILKIFNSYVSLLEQLQL